MEFIVILDHRLLNLLKESSQGPIPAQVIVPGSTWVFPASWIIVTGKFFCLAVCSLQ
jgi:hypothetical protein